ncbi:MAG: ABC transporter ATP-binding protein [Candidatus Micrarchaeia archaeon]
MKKHKHPKIGKTVIELKVAQKIYQMGQVQVPALKDASLKITQGEFVAIIGPSGSGKSTLMNLVGCLDRPTGGHVYLDARDIATMGDSELAQIRGRKIGFVFQKFNLISSLSAIENVMLPLIFQGVSKDERERRAKELLEKVGLGPRINHKPSELSGGEQQRVAIARALAVDPEVVLADEPTGNLDSKTGQEIMEALGKLHEEGKTIIMVTHDKNVARWADRTIKLKDGQIVSK